MGASKNHKMIWTEKGVVVTLAHLQIFQVGANARSSYNRDNTRPHGHCLHKITVWIFQSSRHQISAQKLSRRWSGLLRVRSCALLRQTAGGIRRTSHLEHRLGSIHIGSHGKRSLSDLRADSATVSVWLLDFSGLFFPLRSHCS